MKTGVLTPNKIEGTWERIYSNTITSATSSFSITGLEGNTDVIYRLVTRIISDDVSTPTYRFYLSNDTTDANYGRQNLQAIVSTIIAPRANNYIFFGYADASGQINMADTLIYAKSGYNRIFLLNNVCQISGTRVRRVFICGGVWNDSSTELTSIDLTCDTAGGFGVGSNIELYRLNL
jgi:hypothetical protein